MTGKQAAGHAISSTRMGLLLALAGFMTMSMGDGLVKSTAGQWPGTAVAALRYVIGTIALGVIIMIVRGPQGFRVPRLDIQMGRGVAVGLATLCFFLGVQLMPLADVTAIQFTSPVFVALLAPFLLGERAPRITWLTTAIALIGVAIVLRPNAAALGPAALLPVTAALGMAFLVILNRKMAGLADVLALQFWSALFATPLLLIAAGAGHFSGAPQMQVTMPGAGLILMCAAVALTGTVAHWLLYVATEYASAPVIAPMVYVQLVFAAVIGWAVFGDTIDALGAMGMALIVFSGLLLWRSQRNPAATEAPD